MSTSGSSDYEQEVPGLLGYQFEPSINLPEYSSSGEDEDFWTPQTTK